MVLAPVAITIFIACWSYWRIVCLTVVWCIDFALVPLANAQCCFINKDLYISLFWILYCLVFAQRETLFCLRWSRMTENIVCSWDSYLFFLHKAMSLYVCKFYCVSFEPVFIYVCVYISYSYFDLFDCMSLCLPGSCSFWSLSGKHAILNNETVWRFITFRCPLANFDASALLCVILWFAMHVCIQCRSQVY